LHSAANETDNAARERTGKHSFLQLLTRHDYHWLSFLSHEDLALKAIPKTSYNELQKKAVANLREHVKTVKEVYDRTGTHIPAPTLEYLANRMETDFNDKVSVSTLSRLFKKQCKPDGLTPDEDLIHLWYLCENPDKITEYSADRNNPMLMRIRFWRRFSQRQSSLRSMA
jgi:hypothetical protein